MKDRKLRELLGRAIHFEYLADSLVREQRADMTVRDDPNGGERFAESFRSFRDVTVIQVFASKFA